MPTLPTANPGPNLLVDEDTLWDANDVARYLKVSRSWVYHRAEAGLVPYLRIGGLLRFDPAAIRSFVRDTASAA
jgi:excisionase family DNA binding protein